MSVNERDSVVLKRPRRWARRLGSWSWRAVALAVILGGAAYGSFYLVHQDKFYPGVSVDGINAGGMSRDEVTAQVADRVEQYQGKVIIIRSGDLVWRASVKSLGVKYDVARAVAAAYAVGRTGDWRQKLVDQAAALFGGGVSKTAYVYDDAALTAVLSEVADRVDAPAADATLSYADGELLARAATVGRRLDLGRATAALEARLAAADDADVSAPVYDQQPLVSTAELKTAAAQAKTYVSASITLGLGGGASGQAPASQQEVKPETILTWIKTSHVAADALTIYKTFTTTLNIADFYPAATWSTQAATTTQLGLDRAAVASFVAELAKTTDRDPKNAGVAMADGKLTVTTASIDGAKLDRKPATDAIIAALAQTDPSARTASLTVAVVKPAVREDNLDSLGIKELISEGETYFPGSSTARLTNIRIGSAQFNGALIAPGATFSFGEQLGPVGPEQGYVKGLIILGKKEVPDYGGGLCQVVTTAYRAALLAGLDIRERTNHAFAISFYTWPFNAPGVDATLYYPPVDLKFKNDTTDYILIQTSMSGSHLKFDFYGTKTKYGVIEPPTFLSGSNDVTKPSKTIFYRDIFDMSGKQIAHDPVVTSYASSLDYTVQD